MRENPKATWGIEMARLVVNRMDLRFAGQLGKRAERLREIIEGLNPDVRYNGWSFGEAVFEAAKLAGWDHLREGDTGLMSHGWVLPDAIDAAIAGRLTWPSPLDQETPEQRVRCLLHGLQGQLDSEIGPA